METTIINYLNEKFNVSIPGKTTHEQIEQLLAERINYLITKDFDYLLGILYRIDVSEQKLRSLLKQNPNTDAGKMIAVLVIERQLEKIKLREQFRNDDKNINEEEKW